MFRIFSRKHHSSFLIRQSLGATVVAQREKRREKEKFCYLYGTLGTGRKTRSLRRQNGRTDGWRLTMFKKKRKRFGFRRDVTPFGNRFIYLVTSQGNFQGKSSSAAHPSAGACLPL